MSAAQPPPPTLNNGEQDTTPSRLNQEVQEQPNKGPKIMRRVAFKKLTDEEQLIQYLCSCPKLREKIVLSNILCHTKVGDCIIHHFFYTIIFSLLEGTLKISYKCLLQIFIILSTF